MMLLEFHQTKVIQERQFHSLELHQEPLLFYLIKICFDTNRKIFLFTQRALTILE